MGFLSLLTEIRVLMGSSPSLGRKMWNLEFFAIPTWELEHSLALPPPWKTEKNSTIPCSLLPIPQLDPQILLGFKFYFIFHLLEIKEGINLEI